MHPKRPGVAWKTVNNLSPQEKFNNWRKKNSEKVLFEERK